MEWALCLAVGIVAMAFGVGGGWAGYRWWRSECGNDWAPGDLFISPLFIACGSAVGLIVMACVALLLAVMFWTAMGVLYGIGGLWQAFGYGYGTLISIGVVVGTVQVLLCLWLAFVRLTRKRATPDPYPGITTSSLFNPTAPYDLRGMGGSDDL